MTDNMFEFAAQLVDNLDADAPAGTFTARIVPYGEQVPYGKHMVSFDRGSIEMGDAVPITIDHGDSVLDRIGLSASIVETDTAAYAEMTFADTPNAQTVRELMRSGAVTDVSVGVLLDAPPSGKHVNLSGKLDHISVVAKGRFGNDKIKNPSKVLSVHNEGKPPMAENENAADLVAEYDDSELRDEIVRLSEIVDTMDNRVIDEPALFGSVGEFAKTQAQAALGDDAAIDKMAKFALSIETTTSAAGVVPDYLSSEVLSIVATSRAFVGNIPNDPIGDSGMSVVYPAVTAKGTVEEQSTEGTEVGTSAVTVGVNSTDLKTYAGANRVAAQLVARSAPSYVEILLSELAGQYSEVTDAASIATAIAGAGGTAILADLGADAAATFAAFSVGNAAIIAGVRRPADTVFLASDRWAQINSLVDGDGRPLLVYPSNGPANAQGQSGFDTMVAQYHGWTLRLDVDAADGSCLLAATGKSVANLEMSPAQLSALQVDVLSVDVGIWGLQNVAIKYAAGLYTLTAA